ASRIARSLRDAGVGEGSLVAIVLPTSIDLIAAAFACWMLGATPLPLSGATPARELAAIYEAAAPVAVVDEGSALLAGTQRITDVGEPLTARRKAISSGGSTGLPKVNLDSRPAVINPGEDRFGRLEGPCLIVGGPLYHSS